MLSKEAILQAAVDSGLAFERSDGVYENGIIEGCDIEPEILEMAEQIQEKLLREYGNLIQVEGESDEFEKAVDC